MYKTYQREQGKLMGPRAVPPRAEEPAEDAVLRDLDSEDDRQYSPEQLPHTFLGLREKTYVKRMRFKETLARANEAVWGQFATDTSAALSTAMPSIASQVLGDNLQHYPSVAILAQAISPWVGSGAGDNGGLQHLQRAFDRRGG